MTRQEFADFARGLTAYYGRQAMTPDRLNMIYPKVEHVPAEAAKWILNHITDNSDNMPANIGKALIAGWHEWQRANSARMVQDVAQDCPGCRLGMVFVEHDGGTAVFACPICNQAPAGWPRASRDDLLAEGWRLQPQEIAGMERRAENYHGQLPDARMDGERECYHRVSHLPDYERAQAMAY